MARLLFLEGVGPLASSRRLLAPDFSALTCHLTTIPWPLVYGAKTDLDLSPPTRLPLWSHTTPTPHGRFLEPGRRHGVSGPARLLFSACWPRNVVRSFFSVRGGSVFLFFTYPTAMVRTVGVGSGLVSVLGRSAVFFKLLMFLGCSRVGLFFLTLGTFSPSGCPSAWVFWGSAMLRSMRSFGPVRAREMPLCAFFF